MKNAVSHLEFERIVSTLESAADFSLDEKAHLSDCSDCGRQFRKLQNLFSLAPTKLSEIVPPSATANLLNIFQMPKAKPRRTLTNRLAGLLIFDDWKPEFALNERLSFQDTRQLLYRAGDYSIDLRVNFVDEKCVISGQIFPEISTAVVSIYNANFSHETRLNEYGEFDFPIVEQENFSLQIVIGNEAIEIKDILIAS